MDRYLHVSEKETFNNCLSTSVMENPLTAIDIPFFIKGYIILIAFNSVASFFVVSSNAVVIYTILRTPSLKGPSNYLILGLAIADFAVGFLVQPTFCVMIACMLIGDKTCFRSSLFIFDSSGWALGTATVWTLAALTSDRYIAITYHLRYKEIVTVGRTCVMYAIICICAIASGISWSWSTIPRIIFSCFNTAFGIVNFYIMMKIQKIIGTHSRQIQAQHQPGNLLNIQRMKKKMYMMYYVAGALALCWVPFIICLLVDGQMNLNPLQPMYIIKRISETIVCLNSLLNPIIYFWRIEELRNAARNLIRRVFNSKAAWIT